MDFKNVVVNSEDKIKQLLNQGKPEEFSKELTALYSRMIKFFPNETYTYLKDSGFNSLLEEVVSDTKKNLLEKYKTYEVDYGNKTVVLTRKDSLKETFFLFDIVFVLENGFGITKDSEGFYLKLSCVMQPSQFEILQLFGYFNLKD